MQATIVLVSAHTARNDVPADQQQRGPEPAARGLFTLSNASIKVKTGNYPVIYKYILS